MIKSVREKERKQSKGRKEGCAGSGRGEGEDGVGGHNVWARELRFFALCGSSVN